MFGLKTINLCRAALHVPVKDKSSAAYLEMWGDNGSLCVKVYVCQNLIVRVETNEHVLFNTSTTFVSTVLAKLR